MGKTVTLYGIKTCSTVKKAMKWLEEQGVVFQYHDLRKDGLTETQLGQWCAATGWEKLLNRSSMTFRKLDEADKQDIDEGKARKLMLAHPTLIRRPVLDDGGQVLIGFKPEIYEAAFSHAG